MGGACREQAVGEIGAGCWAPTYSDSSTVGGCSNSTPLLSSSPEIAPAMLALSSRRALRNPLDLEQGPEHDQHRLIGRRRPVDEASRRNVLNLVVTHEQSHRHVRVEGDAHRDDRFAAFVATRTLNGFMSSIET